MKQIKWAWQRMTRGYDDRIMWGFDDYLWGIVKPSLHKFLIDRKFDKGFIEHNPEKAKTDDEMLDLLNKAIASGYSDQFDYPNSQSKFWEYFGKHIANFWN